jgi:hypothetical protein
MSISVAESQLPQPVETQRENQFRWSRMRWVMTVALVFGVQVGLVFLLGDRKPLVARLPALVPQLSLTTDGGEWLALSDPTLFALPHLSGFSGAAWLKSREANPVPLIWTGSPKWLDLSSGGLVGAFSEFVATNRFARYVPESKPKPAPTFPEAEASGVLPEAKSELTVEGGLAGRTLLNPPVLASQPASDVLANSVVQVLVDAEGKVISTVLMLPGSGLKEADQRALGVAKAARFEPLPRASDRTGGEPDWTRGRMVFQWRVEPLVRTNQTPAIP